MTKIMIRLVRWRSLLGILLTTSLALLIVSDSIYTTTYLTHRPTIMSSSLSYSAFWEGPPPFNNNLIFGLEELESERLRRENFSLVDIADWLQQAKKASQLASPPEDVKKTATSPTPSTPSTASIPVLKPSKRVNVVPPSFNFSVPQPKSGCELDLAPSLHKINAVFSNFDRKIALTDMTEIVQAGTNPGEILSSSSSSSLSGNLEHRRQAVCKFRRFGNYAHFPHTMQQFSRCFSFWQIFSTYDPVLLMYKHVHGDEKNYEFNDGMLALFRDVFNVTVVYDMDKSDQQILLVKPLYDTSMEESMQQGIVFQTEEHAQILRERVHAHYDIHPAGCASNKTEPIIGILNRSPQSNRTIANLARAQKFLGKLSSHPVQVEYFEGKSFMEQVTFMSQVDILVSPHGAQLTSANFIPKCGGLFEVFPSGYYLPHFFGPLATTSGLQHAFVYTGVDVQKEWYQGSRVDRRARIRARHQNVCIPLQTSLEIIGQMVDNWKTCCQGEQ